MLLRKIIAFTKSLENPKYPLLGPNIKGLYWCGLWHGDSIIRNVCFGIAMFSCVLFVICQIVEMFILRNDPNKFFNNISVTALSLVCTVKSLNVKINQRKWKKIVYRVSKYEITDLNEMDKDTIEVMTTYTKYSRNLTFMYWILVFITGIGMIVTPIAKYLTIIRDENIDSTELYPEIISSWFPFDKTRKPGTIIAGLINAFMSIYGAATVGNFDMNAIAILSFFKGQFIILRKKCIKIFDEETYSKKKILMGIKDCHWRHSYLIETYRLFDSLLSPTMFLYVLVCSVMICCNVVQYTSKNITASQKIWILQYSVYLISQLFLYCWHSNEVTVESKRIAQGIYTSKWWKADHHMRKQILLLAGKQHFEVILHAGPFTVLSISTFIEILKGSYSFYTLFSKMQE